MGRFDHTQISEAQESLNGTVATLPNNNFYAQMIYQHIHAYPELLKVTGLEGNIDCSAQNPGQLP